MSRETDAFVKRSQQGRQLALKFCSRQGKVLGIISSGILGLLYTVPAVSAVI